MPTTPPIQAQALSIASSLRRGRNIEVSTQIIALGDHFSSLAPSLNPQQLSLMQTLFGEILAAQERQDWLAMADYLEYELQDLIKSLPSSI